MQSLEEYRQKSNLNARALKVYLNGGAESLAFQENVWKTFESDPLFKKKPCQNLDEERRVTFLRFRRLFEYGFVQPDAFLTETWKVHAFRRALQAYDSSLSMKWQLNSMVFYIAVGQLGSYQHFQLLEKVANFEIVGCLALTEMSHGSNARAIQTTATYDPLTSEFVLNTPSLEATKMWVGNMGKTATHALVFAQLRTPDGKEHGLHGFVVPLRDPLTLKTYPGLVLGDMGEKLGVNGVDNGFLRLQQYRVPKDSLLARSVKFSDKGELLMKSKAEQMREIHALSCVNKAVTTWTAMRCIQECRETCGGHGYLKINRLGDLRNDTDPSQTYEGDNNVILQQTANYLLDFYPLVRDGKRVTSPMYSVDFAFGRANQLLRAKSLAQDSVPLMDAIKDVYEWLACRLLLRYGDAYSAKLQASGGSTFEAINETRVHLGQLLPVVYYELNAIHWFNDMLADPALPADAWPVLLRMHRLAAATLLEKHLGTLLAESCPITASFAQRLRAEIRSDCGSLLPHAIKCTDALAPPDFILNSAIGAQDGRAYERMWAEMISAPGAMDRPAWWVEWAGAEEARLKSKL